jgi:hypothetical protein
MININRQPDAMLVTLEEEYSGFTALDRGTDDRKVLVVRIMMRKHHMCSLSDY